MYASQLLPPGYVAALSGRQPRERAHPYISHTVPVVYELPHKAALPHERVGYKLAESRQDKAVTAGQLENMIFPYQGKNKGALYIKAEERKYTSVEELRQLGLNLNLYGRN